MEQKEIQIVILVTAILFFTVFGMILFFLYVFQRKKTDYLLKQREQEQKFSEILVRSQMEIKENTLKSIAWELHDNIGQLLSLAKMELNILSMQNQITPEKIQNVAQLVGKTLQEIRMFSRILNQDVINSIGIKQAIQIEVDRLNRMQFLNASLKVKGTPVDIDSRDEIILFRIVQEFFSNTIKHSKAKNLNVTLQYDNNHLIISLQDDGVGFDKDRVKQGSGMLNMSGRAEMIHTRLNIQSGLEGTIVTIDYPIRKSRI